MSKGKTRPVEMTRISTFIRGDQFEALKARQERDGVPVSVQIRRALDAALGTKPERKGDRP
jgi:hypothetical protein